ncbi:hypothetical protein BJ982_007292 [Sphaerisporangium siamense]|uniref:Uncharacterized protein n=1 Tax=Sphaerisporangium siamense TaxID=795645 RepID=A0A7W7DFB2_9ACTN|nr:hypothetical protein [Sphaerisporangium siamense]
MGSAWRKGKDEPAEMRLAGTGLVSEVERDTAGGVSW